MLDQIESMFSNYEFLITMSAAKQEPLFKRSRKKEIYETNMKDFREKNDRYFTEMMDMMDAAEDKSAKAQEISDCIVDAVAKKYIDFDRFRRGRRIMDMGLFFIYYMFPAILLTGNENAVSLCDTLRDTWNRRMKENIEYSDYNDLYNTFNDKIFGIMY